MPKKHEIKADHNKNFLNSIHEDYPEDFFDWKVTVQFYSGLHRCYCVLRTKQIEVVASHNQNIKNLKTVDENLAKAIRRLFGYSKLSRYDAFLDEEAMNRINRINFTEGVSLLKKIENGVLDYYPVAQTA